MFESPTINHFFFGSNDHVVIFLLVGMCLKGLNTSVDVVGVGKVSVF